MGAPKTAAEKVVRVSQVDARCATTSRALELKELAQAVIDWADNEYDAAQDNLRQHESEPGIPLPQYRDVAVCGAREDAGEGA